MKKLLLVFFVAALANFTVARANGPTEDAPLLLKWTRQMHRLVYHRDGVSIQSVGGEAVFHWSHHLCGGGGAGAG